MIATSLGAGLLPGAPGTYGSLSALPVAFLLGRLGPAAYAGCTLGVVVVGTWAAGRFCAASGQPDDQRVVIDEVAGCLVALSLGPYTWPGMLLGFGLFRLLDIWKPGPLRWLDRHVRGGVGVMADDVLAGALAALCLRGLLLLPLPWASWGIL
ncbi:MAG: phosphatidylglycerophosphatase A [Myxococcales bacterium]|nr:phosphatidylglycerophosphatase A [Myxococcota bacterium]MDW8283719.1 phosphatidylglycerophosphatase A [Myxococcales bacterium]